MGLVAVERNRIGNLLRLGIDVHVYTRTAEHGKRFAIEGSNGLGRQINSALLPIRSPQFQLVLEKIELELEFAAIVWNW